MQMVVPRYLHGRAPPGCDETSAIQDSSCIKICATVSSAAYVEGRIRMGSSSAYCSAHHSQAQA